MSDHDYMDRIQQQMDKLTDKVDQVLSVVSDIKANEQLTKRQFDEIERRLEGLEKSTVSKEQFKPVERSYLWIMRTVITVIAGAVMALVIAQPGVDVIIPKQKSEKPSITQTVEE